MQDGGTISFPANHWLLAATPVPLVWYKLAYRSLAHGCLVATGIDNQQKKIENERVVTRKASMWDSLLVLIFWIMFAPISTTAPQASEAGTYSQLGRENRFRSQANRSERKATSNDLEENMWLLF